MIQRAFTKRPKEKAEDYHGKSKKDALRRDGAWWSKWSG
jgi:hypothetical protein